MPQSSEEQAEMCPRLTCKDCKRDITILRYTVWGVVIICRSCGVRYTIPDEDLVSYR